METPTEVPLIDRSKEELVAIVGRLKENLSWYVEERNRLIAESQAPQPPCESNSITYRALEVVSDEPEPEKCPTCNGYHLGGCHRKAELGDGEPSPSFQKRGRDMAAVPDFAGATPNSFKSVRELQGYKKCHKCGTEWLGEIEKCPNCATGEPSPLDHCNCAAGDDAYLACHADWCNFGRVGSLAKNLAKRSGAAQEVSPSANFVSEIRPRPDDPSCHVCGAQMVVKEWKCLSCKATTGVEEVSPPSPEQVCVFTHNRVGTDTWAAGYVCPCGSCQKWLKDQQFAGKEGMPELDSPNAAATSEARNLLSRNSQSAREFLLTRRGFSGRETIVTSLDKLCADLEAYAEMRGDTRELKAALQATLPYIRHSKDECCRTSNCGQCEVVKRAEKALKE